MIFHSPQAKLVESIVIGFCRKKIQCENYVKFLGILLNANLNWKHHINELSKKLARTIGIFHKINCVLFHMKYYDYFVIPCFIHLFHME